MECEREGGPDSGWRLRSAGILGPQILLIRLLLSFETLAKDRLTLRV